MIAAADLDGPLVNYQAKGNRVTLVGVDTADGRPAYVLHVVRRDSTEDRYYIDTTSALQVRWEGHRMQNGVPVVFDTYFRDYRRVSGVMVAFRTDSETRGRPGATHILFDSVAINVPIDRSRFVMPGGSRWPAASRNDGGDGAEGIRTLDPRLAKPVLSQLSYRPDNQV